MGAEENRELIEKWYIALEKNLRYYYHDDGLAGEWFYRKISRRLYL